MKTTLTLSSTHLAQNFHAVRRGAGEDTAVLAVIKANAYGHSAELCAPVLLQAGAQWFGVSDVEEGAAVRRVLGSRAARLLAMCGMERSDAPSLLTHDITPVVWTTGHLESMEQAARTIGRTAAVHLKVDTGMSRQGAQPGEPLAAVLHRLASSSWLTCEGVLTHLACAEEVGSTVTALQRERFVHALVQVLAAGVRPQLLHVANSSALDEASTTGWLRELAHTHGVQPMVRTGLALYGRCLPLAHTAQDAQTRATLAPVLQPVLHWTTRVIDTREIAAGESVGYGATWTAARATKLALLPVGYADGFRRGASSGVGNGWAMIQGQHAPVAGRVSMNLTTVDVTDLAHVRVGDEVTLLGPGVSAEDHARWNNTIPYEILCGLRGHRVLAPATAD